jgi:quercetin dioxygenase-like cupin family protein
MSHKDRGTAAALAERLAQPVLAFHLEDEAARLRTGEPWERSGRNAKTLVKRDDFRVVLTVMKAGNRIKEHKAAGSISVQTLAGHIRLHLPEEKVDLPAGQLLALDAALPHDVETVRESAFLLTLSWRRNTED